MFAHLPHQILLVLHILTSHSEGRPRDCSRVFHFDFEKHVQQGAGGIWQGEEGEVTFREGKAWFVGNGSLIYPFFSNNDLRPSFAFSFKVKPVRFATSGLVAIITNDLAPGSSTLTVFHNDTCLGVKVVETAEPLAWTEAVESSRKVELSVHYTKPEHNQRTKRSSEQAEDVSTGTITVSNDKNGSMATGSNSSSPSSGVITGTTSSSSGIEDSGDGDSPNNLGQEESPQDEKGTTLYETVVSESLIAVRRLFKIRDKVYVPKTTTKKPTTKSTYKTTTTSTTPPSTAPVVNTQRETDEGDSSERLMDNIEVQTDSINNAQDTPSTTISSIEMMGEYAARPEITLSSSGYRLIEEQTTLPSRTTVHPTSTTDSSSKLNSIISYRVLPVGSYIVKPALQHTTPRFVAMVIGKLTTAPPVHVQTTRIKSLPTETKVPIMSHGNNRFLVVPNIFKGRQDSHEIEVRIAQDNGVLSLQVGNSVVQKTNVGSMEHVKAPRSALRVGAGDGLRPYRGSFDEFIMYDCAPENFFQEEGPLQGTLSDIWTRRQDDAKS